MILFKFLMQKINKIKIILRKHAFEKFKKY
jgi:hypothetical protein